MVLSILVLQIPTRFLKKIFLELNVKKKKTREFRFFDPEKSSHSRFLGFGTKLKPFRSLLIPYNSYNNKVRLC